MPQVGVNNEPLFERVVFAYDGTNYRVVKGDAAGNLVVAIKASQQVEVVQDTAADLKATVTLPSGQDIEARGQGYYDAAWRKAPVPFGPSDNWREKITHTVSGTGTQTAHGAAVDSGVLRVITGISAQYVGAATPDIICGATIDAQFTPFYEFGGIADDVWQGWQMWALLDVGDKMTWYIQTPGDGQVAYLYAYGYIIDQLAA